MDFLEKNLEDIIFETDNDLLHDRGLFVFGKKKRQVNLGNYGIADIVSLSHGYDPIGNPNLRKHPMVSFGVIELKKDKIDIGTFLQALRYCKAIETYVEMREIYKSAQLNFSITLIGKTLDKSSGFIYLTDFLSQDKSIFSDFPYLTLDIYTYSYAFDGIKFTREHDYSLIGHGFNLNNCKSYQNKNKPF
jgi:hypothetical protein